ncbi:unnamed protein product, partial [Mesorhabditis belari]|uniref:WD repeat and FYVE domain-containing protein 3 n=1 Tax=Mesorhabditis belari TaxID=2138241 RepID=A0AAF3FM46_9BILA
MVDRNERTLTLLHLRKTFSDHSKVSLSGTKEVDASRLLPLFTKVMTMYSPVELRGEFKEMPTFSAWMCSLLVREVRARAASQGTEAAAVGIAEYLEQSTSHKGWTLLSAILYAVNTDDDAIIDAACKASLPSTLVKALYLFFDLPEADGETLEAHQKLNDLVTELLERLCNFKSVGEELARRDDLSLLFAGTSSMVPQQNAQWRRTSARVLETLAAKALTPQLVKYILSKECIPTYVNNMRNPKLSLQETAEMIICLLCILKDSARSSSSLTDIFQKASGYEIIKDFLIRHESDTELVRNILLMLISVITAGPIELKPQHNSGLVSLPNFTLPIPIGNGVSVRNTAAFRLLYEIFVESLNPKVHVSVIDVVHSIYTCDPANYFILDREFPLSIFIERMATRCAEVQLKILELIEHVCFQLAYIPCKEMISVCVLMKTELGAGRPSMLIHAVQSAFRILTVDSLLKDAFREVGMLDTLSFVINNLFGVQKNRELTDEEKKLTLLATDLLTVVVKGNVENAKMLGDCLGPRGLLALVCGVSGEWRSSALQLLKQALLLAPSDIYLAAIVSQLNNASPQTQLELDVDLLKCVLGVLRESHKVRVLFRRVGGYLALISMLLGLEGVFGSEESAKDAQSQQEKSVYLDFIHLVFKVLTLSMRFEPSNARYFFVEVNWESITTVLRLTGTFAGSTIVEIENYMWRMNGAELKEEMNLCHSVFQMDENIQLGSIPPKMPASIFYSCYIIRLLFNMALDNYEKVSSDVCWCTSLSPPDGSSSLAADDSSIVSWSSSVLVHPGAVLSILALLPSIQAQDKKWTVAAQYYSSLLLKALLKPERNQQLMSQVEMPRHLLAVAGKLFLSDNHLLLPPFYYLLERLSYQSMHPRELRQFLRLDQPLCCRNLDPAQNEEALNPNEGGPIPLTRVKALVSMMTPRSARPQPSPSFIEFDQALEGFGCLFIPSLSPTFSSQRTERVFPPMNGFTFSTWLYVDCWSDKKTDAHPLRLLTVSRTVIWNDERKKLGARSVGCLCLQLSAMDHSLLVSTEETEPPGGDIEKDARFPSEKVVRVALEDVLRPMEWAHLCVVLTRSVLKPSQVNVYANGRLVSTQRLSYIVPNPGGAAPQLATTAAVNAFIGTPPNMRRPSRLRFRLASTYIIEEPITPEIVRSIYQLQPHYIGNLQTAGPDGAPLIGDEKILFSLNGAAMSELTLAKIRAMYSKIDSESLAPHLGISPQDNSTQLRVMQNTASHLPGAGRAFGAVLAGYLGMRSFTPCPVPRLLDSMGGYAPLFGLIEMAVDSEGLYASLKALVSATRSNTTLHESLAENRAYQTLAVLIEDKSRLLNSHIMHMIFTLVGTLDTSREAAYIPCSQAFDDVLCDLDVWRGAPDELHKMLQEHFYELITDHQASNLQTVRRSPLLPRLLYTFFDSSHLLPTTNDIIFNLISAIIQPPCDSRSILKIGQTIAATLPSTTEDGMLEEGLPFHISELQSMVIGSGLPLEKGKNPPIVYLVYVRNRILNLLANILAHSSVQSNQHMCEQMVRVLGFDWLLSLLSPRVHSGTIHLALRILLNLLAHENLMNKFREGTGNGGWLNDADSVVRNRAAVVLGFSVSAHGGSVGSHVDINPELQNCNGFAALEHVLSSHAHLPHPHFALLSLLVGQPVKQLRFCDHFSVDLVWTHVFGLSPNSSVFEALNSANFCYDALLPLLSMIRSAIHCEQRLKSDGWHITHPSALLQIIGFFYQNSAHFYQMAHSEEFVIALFSTLFKESSNSRGDRGSSTPPEAIEALTSLVAKQVIDLIRKIICDDMQSTPPGARSEPLLDVLVEHVCEGGGGARGHALSVVVLAVLDHFVSTDLLVSSSLPPQISCNPLNQQGSNMFNFATKTVEALWNGNLPSAEPIRILTALYHMHSIGTRKDNSAMQVDPLLMAIMRCVLYILSRPIDSVNTQLAVLDTLGSVVNKKYIFLSSNESWFFGALCHLIFMLSVTPDILEHGNTPLDRNSAQVAVCASRIWTDVLIQKKGFLEEIFKRQTVVELNAARALLAHAAGVHWSQFVDSQLKTVSQTSAKEQFQQQISSRITKVASGLHRLASKRGVTSVGSLQSMVPWKNHDISEEVVLMWVRVHTSLVKELVTAQAARYHEWHSHVRKWSLQEWHQIEQELIRERGLWGPEQASTLEKYQLDVTEGPSRMRRKMIPNREFYHMYPFRPHLESPNAKALRAKVAISKDATLYYEAMKSRRGRLMDARIIDDSLSSITPSQETLPFPDGIQDLDQLNSSLIRRLSSRPPHLNDTEAKSESNGEKEETEADAEEKEINDEELPEDPAQSTSSVNAEKKAETRKEQEEERNQRRGPDNQTLLRLLEQGENLHSMFRCARVQGLETSEGLLLFGKDHYYVVDGFTLLKTREIRDLDFLPPELHDPIVPYTATGATRPPRASRLCSKFSYDDIREVHKRRYLLQPIALEVFSADGRNYLLAFPKKMRDRVFDKLLSMARRLNESGTESVSGQKASMAVETMGRPLSLLNSLVGQQSVTQRWLNGQITNFQYLMHLNTLAGRSYNDLSQYPVFPWVLNDYTSKTLDLTNPNSFRDLSKSMGAQNDDRLEQFLKRYREWDDPTGETPPYMYGTHYSSAMIVVSYLVRLEPFTQQFLTLQGGHFDLADRMFHSVGDAFLSAAKNNMADVKELIPEFYLLPELFQNKNRFDLGVKQSGVALDDVVLPPWANGDPREFVRLHRAALECDLVSAHLHEWIDLVFGYKQQGESAIQANNVFHHLFYEESVDFEAIDDQLTRNATIGFVNNFGQIPTQLFKKPHPQKKVNSSEGYSSINGVTTPKLFYHALHSLKPPQVAVKELRTAVGAMHVSEKGIVAVEAGKVLLSPTKYLAWGFPDRSIRLGTVDSDKSSCILEMCDTQELTCVAAGDERTVFCGSSTGCVSVWNLYKKHPRMRKIRTLDGHSDAVTCIEVCSAHTFVVSASRDCSVIVWHERELSLLRQLPPHPSPVSALAVNHTTGDIASACASLLFLWSINGDLLVQINTSDCAPALDHNQMIVTLAFSTLNEWDPDNVVMAGTADGVVKIFSSAIVENDGSVAPPQQSFNTLERKKSTSSAVSVAERLERQRRRLRVGASVETTSSSHGTEDSHSPDPPTSPFIGADNMDGELEEGRKDPRMIESAPWVRVLVQRAALTMHTAFSRPDNLRPAPITVIIPSKDHRSLLVGDGVGRVWQWQIGEEGTGNRADHWVQDVARQRCTHCHHKFSIADRKHHCRNCGQIFCAKCSRFESHITHMKISRPVRVCQNCYLRLKAQTPS